MSTTHFLRYNETQIERYAKLADFRLKHLVENLSETAQGHNPAPASSWFKPRSVRIEPGDLMLLVTTDHKRYLLSVQPHQQLHTHVGIYAYDHMIGQPPGATILSTLGYPALVLEPSLTDLIQHLKRGTQIIYPKDAAYLVHRLNLRAGSHIIEAGTGSACVSGWTAATSTTASDAAPTSASATVASAAGSGVAVGGNSTAGALSSG